ncbi:MAG: hypothetical protein ACPGYT_02490 [Nitrospirales bacterium]
MTINNLGGRNWGHLRIGRFDPSAYFSLPTSRPTFVPIGPELAPPFTQFSVPTINRIGIFPSAFSAKFSGLFERNGTAILPFTSSLFNSGHEVGIDIHGRPFGDWFLYQIGVLNGANERFGDSNNAKDWYVLVRLDHGDSDYFSANLSGFAYFGDENALVSPLFPAVNWSRYGIGARVRYRWLEMLGAFTYDRITNVPVALSSTFDETASGLTVEVHVILTDRLVTSIRYNHLDAGGILAARKSLSVLGVQAQYYLRSNIAFFVRDEVNVRASEGGSSPERNFRNLLMAGVSSAF